MLAADDLADWYELESVERAKQYVTAVMRMVTLKPKAVQLGGAAGESFVNDLAAHLELLKKAKEFVAAYRAGQNQVQYVDISRYRD